ncbi:MAG: hypothetical protein AAFX87_20825 [Bacteroidota bacterium]
MATEASVFRKAYQFGGKFINYRMGAYAATIMGGIVWVINFDHGVVPATTAGLKQAAYTFLFGGLLIKLLERLAINIRQKWAAIILAAVIPSILTISAVFLVHNLKGTPKPLASTVPTMLVAPPGFLFMAYRKRKETDNPEAKFKIYK